LGCFFHGRCLFLHTRVLQWASLLSYHIIPGGQRAVLEGEERMELPTYADVLAAEPVVRRHLQPTPLYEWPALSALLGCRYYLKHENHTPTTAFKVRGGIS